MQRFMSVFAVVVGLCLTSGIQSSAYSQVSTTLPVERGARDHFIITVSINGRGPFAMVVDTGAGISAITPELIKSLALTPVPGDSLSAHGATGPVSIDTYRLESLDLGGLVIEDIRVLGPAPNGKPDFGGDVIHGVLGADILRRYLVRFDATRAEFRLYDPQSDLLPGTARWPHASLRRGRGDLIYTNVNINGIDIDSLVDSGASRSIMNWRAAKAAGYTPTDPRVGDDDRPVTGYNGREVPARRIDGVRVLLGNAEFPKQRITIADLPIFDTLQLSDGAAMLIGAPVLWQRDFVIDYVNMTIRFAPAAPATTTSTDTRQR